MCILIKLGIFLIVDLLLNYFIVMIKSILLKKLTSILYNIFSANLMSSLLFDIKYIINIL